MLCKAKGQVKKVKIWQKIGLLLTLIVCVLIVGHMEYEQELQEEAWVKSVQALELQQQEIQALIEETREELAKADHTLHEHHILIWDIRNRLHLDLEAELEEEKNKEDLKE